jgi:hypothetical protein
VFSPLNATHFNGKEKYKSRSHIFLINDFLKNVIEYEAWLGVGNKVYASYGDLILAKITILTSPYKIL